VIRKEFRTAINDETRIPFGWMGVWLGDGWNRFHNMTGQK
jgi:hypothetical protein